MKGSYSSLFHLQVLATRDHFFCWSIQLIDLLNCSEVQAAACMLWLYKHIPSPCINKKQTQVAGWPTAKNANRKGTRRKKMAPSSYFLLAVLLALVACLGNASDPSPLQDFCVADKHSPGMHACTCCNSCSFDVNAINKNQNGNHLSEGTYILLCMCFASSICTVNRVMVCATQFLILYI